MTRDEFLQQYDPKHKMHVKYRDHVTGEVRKGLLMDTIQTGVYGHSYVNIDNFYCRAFLDDVIEIKSTGVPW